LYHAQATCIGKHHVFAHTKIVALVRTSHLTRCSPNTKPTLLTLFLLHASGLTHVCLDTV
jgi:predicted glycosyltransferase